MYRKCRGGWRVEPAPLHRTLVPAKKTKRGHSTLTQRYAAGGMAVEDQ